MTLRQAGFDVRCEWGAHGVTTLGPGSDAVIIVDVMSFSTAVVVAASRGIRVHPYRWNDGSQAAFAASIGAELAGPRGEAVYSLSPASLTGLPRGACLVLPSPNGATLSLSTGGRPTFAGCLRNARAVARAAALRGRRVAVIPCGERWPEDDSLRPALEDLIGAGAIIQHLPGFRSPEAQAAVAAFREVEPVLCAALRACESGRDLVVRGFGDDIPPTADLDADSCAPILLDGVYRPDAWTADGAGDDEPRG